MLKRVYLILLAIAMYIPLYAQQGKGAGDTSQVHDKSHLRISLLTCGPGKEVYETFGHSCIRIIDSTRSGRDRDVIYNYGFLESSPENTVMHQFLTGRILVFLATNTYDEFKYEYVTDKKRLIEEQVFLLNSEQKATILSYLNNNLRRENKYYEYNSVYDNCSTRILGMFMTTFGNHFVPGQVIPKDSRLTFRDLTKRCGPQQRQHKYWYSLAMKLFFGSRSDKIATNTEAMYLADYLSDGMAGAAIDGKKLCTDKTTLFDEGIDWGPATDEPFILLIIIAAVTIPSLLVKKLNMWGTVMSFMVLVASGILGCCILYLGMIDAEPGWKDNFNVLWALPTNLIIPFCGPKIRAKYAIIAIGLIGVSLILHIMRIQELPLYEIASLLLTLLFIYGIMYKKATWKINATGYKRSSK